MGKKIKQEIFRKLAWCAVLVAVCGILASCSGTQKQEENGTDEGQGNAAASVSDTDNTKTDKTEAVNDRRKADKNRKDKEETVYVTSNADGSVKKIEVETVLKAVDGSEPIVDYSLLRNIRNTEGDEEFTKENDGSLSWENKGENISYKGDMEGELPVSVHISYYLDGKEMQPEEMAGATGEVKIRFDYENHVTQTVQADGADVSVCVPFAAITALALPADTFFDVEVDGGKLVSMDEQNLVIGIAYPGLADSLKLAEYEPAEDISIQDYVEVSAYAEGFSLSFTDTIVTTGTFSDMDLDSLEDVDDLVDSMKELADATDELEKGAEELNKGAGKFGGYLDSFLDGVNTLDMGAGQLTEGVRALNDSKGQLLEGAQALQSSLEALDSKLAELENLSGMDTGQQELDAGLQELIMNLKELKAVTSQLVAGSSQLTTGLGTFCDGLGQVYDGAVALQNGTSKLRSSGAELNSGYDELVNGTEKLQDGVKEYKEEGIQELTKLAGDDLSALVTRIRALQQADSMYYNYGGIREGQTGSVRFIIETDAIE